MNDSRHDLDDARRDNSNQSGGHDLTVPYALDAVADGERVQAEAHLATCASCALELEAIRWTLDDVAAVTAVEPRPSSRTAVLARIVDIPQVSAITQAVPVVAGAPAPVDELALRRARRSQRLLAPLAAAAAVLLVAAGGLGITTWQLHSSRDAARAQASAITQVVGQPDAQAVSVARSDAAWSTAKVMVSRSAGEAVLVADSAPAAPAGHTWQLWFLSGGVAHSAGLLTSATAQRLSGSVGSSTGVAVSLEPSGGSTRPTTTPVATFALPT